MRRHLRDSFYVLGEGILHAGPDGESPACERPSTEASLRKFRFSRLGPKGGTVDREVLKKVATAMTPGGRQPGSDVPAGFTYLGQFVDHDMTMDVTRAALGEHVTVSELLQGRSPALDLDSLYGRGPGDRDDDRYYDDGRAKLKVGVTAAIAGIPGVSDAGTNVNLNGFDLPRVGFGSTKRERQKALIPDQRNDENLAVAQLHLAFIRFHNRVVDILADRGTPSALLFPAARDLVVRHYQWLLRQDFLPRIVEREIVDDVFTNGRRFFEVPSPVDGPYLHVKPGDMPTMPIEFSVGAYRLGHAMVRSNYAWNRIFRTATMTQLFQFSGTSGNFNALADPNEQDSGLFERLPTNWIVDWRRLFDFRRAEGDGIPAPNTAMRIDTLLVDPLATLPRGSFGGGQTAPADPAELNLAFRNLLRASMVELGSGQQLAEFLGIEALKPDDILHVRRDGDGRPLGADLEAVDLTGDELSRLAEHTPLWFYVLREAELGNGRLTGVGGRIAAETFHRAMEGSRISIVREPHWRPSLGPDRETFRMTDLLLQAYGEEQLNPLGDTAP